MNDLSLQIIEKTAKVPSFSSFEERLHPLLIGLVRNELDIRYRVIDERNLVFYLPGKKNGIVALTAHLDKINHFGEDWPVELPFYMDDTDLCGQLDNTVGIGITMATLLESVGENRPSILVLLSEMEESTGLKNHPNLLRNEGKGLSHGMGAKRICNWMKSENIFPDAIITVDTTPLFKGKPGVALYSKHWENKKTIPTEAEVEATSTLVKQFTFMHPEIFLGNNTNDYLHYGSEMNLPDGPAVPSIAIEPAIHPYHTKNEKVFIKDILTIREMLADYLDSFEK